MADPKVFEELAREKISTLFSLFQESFTEKGKVEEIPDAIKFLVGTSGEGTDIKCSPIGLADGLANYIYRLSKPSTGESVVVKWSCMIPKIQEAYSVGLPEDELTTMLQRNIIECKSLRTINKYVPGSTPEIYWNDSDRYFFIMEDLGDAVTLKEQLDNGVVMPDAFTGIAKFMSQLHKQTHVKTLEKEEFEHLNKEFNVKNAYFIDVLVDWFIGDAFSGTSDNAKIRRHTKCLDQILPEVIDNPKIEAAKLILKRSFKNTEICFVHNDSHPGFVMVNPKDNSLKFIDGEIGMLGNPAKEVGYFLGEVIVWYYVNLGREKTEVCQQIKASSEKMLSTYIKKMGELITDLGEFMNYVAIHAGHLNAIRVVNIHPFPQFDNLEEAEAHCVLVAARLMKEMKRIKTIPEFMSLAFSDIEKKNL